jgi:hypothetical protein
VGETTTTTIFSGGGLTITFVCSSAGEPTINLTAPAPNTGELNWSGNDALTNFGGLQAGFGAAPIDITSGNHRGDGTFAYSAVPPGAVVTGTLGWDDTPVHNGTTGCAVWGHVVSG